MTIKNPRFGIYKGTEDSAELITFTKQRQTKYQGATSKDLIFSKGEGYYKSFCLTKKEKAKLAFIIKHGLID